MFLPTCNVINFPISALTFNEHVDVILGWAQKRLSRTVCVANVHMLMEARENTGFGNVLLRADMITPDGMPLVWLMNLMRAGCQDRVAGMDLLLALCKQAEAQGVSVFFLGSTPEVLQRIQQKLRVQFPDLQIAGIKPLPFRPLTHEEDLAIVEEINCSNAGLVMVSLGCPKQEWWMHYHKDRVHAVMIGLGGVFPVYAGILKWAPVWVQKSGFEWLYRLVQEPGRLWKRYASTIPPFLFLALVQIVKNQLGLSKMEVRPPFAQASNQRKSI